MNINSITLYYYFVFTTIPMTYSYRLAHIPTMLAALAVRNNGKETLLKTCAIFICSFT